MAFGFENINDYGSVQIDQDYKSIAFVSKSTKNSLTSSAFQSTYMGGLFWDNPNYVYWVVEYTGTSPILAVTVPSGRQLFPIRYFDETNTLGLPPEGTRRAIFYSPGTTAASINAYVFDDVNLAGFNDTGYGIQVKNSSNSVVYHSNKPVFRATNIMTLRLSTIGQTVPKVSGKTYAYVFCNKTQGFYYPSGTLVYPHMTGIENTSSTAATIRGVESVYDFADPRNGPIDANPTSAFQVDVTNL